MNIRQHTALGITYIVNLPVCDFIVFSLFRPDIYLSINMNKQQGNVGSSNGTVIRESDEKQNMNNSSIITDNITVYNNTVGGKTHEKNYLKRN